MNLPERSLTKKGLARKSAIRCLFFLACSFFLIFLSIFLSIFLITGSVEAAFLNLSKYGNSSYGNSSSKRPLYIEVVSSDNISRFSLPGDVAVKGVTASGEVLLKEMPGSGRRSELALAPKSLDVLVKIGHKLGKLFIYVYVDNGAKTSARVKLSGLANLSYKRPLNLAFSKSVRFTLANEDETPATLKQLSISVTFT